MNTEKKVTEINPLAGVISGKDSLETLLAVGMAQVPVVATHGSDPVLLVPKDYRVESLEKYLPPSKIVEVVQCSDAASFATYVNRFKTPDTILLAQVSDTDGRLEAIIDYHTAQRVPQRCSHRATLVLEKTPEWKRWMEKDRKPMTQAEFVFWLEDNAPLIVDPPGASLLEMLLTLEGKSNVSFTSGVRTQNGANRLVYLEDVDLKGQSQGTVELPQVITAGLAPFMGMETGYRVRARLRYRIEGRKLTFWYETVNPHVFVRDAIADIVRQVTEATLLKPIRAIRA